MLQRFEIELVDEKMPTVNEAEPSLGAIRLIGDIRVRIKERKL